MRRKIEPFAPSRRAPETAESVAPPPRPDAAHSYNWGAIGLELKPIKIPAEDLVIDRIERPSAN
jgi:hypothetical protein